MENVAKGGKNVIKAHLKHLKYHDEEGFYNEAIEYLKQNNIEVPQPDEEKPLPCGCPGSFQMSLGQKDLSKMKKQTPAQAQPLNMQSELNNWPIQLKLLNPNAAYFKNADLVIAADCSAFAYPNFHGKFLKDKILIMFCPKLDTNLEIYVEKLQQIFEKQDINSVSIVHMEVPCCGGIEMIVKEAMTKANKNIIIKDYTISLTGELI